MSEIQNRIDKHYTGYRLVDHTTVNDKALFMCPHGHFFEATLKYLLYYDDRAKEPCTRCYPTNKRRKEVTDLKLLDELIKTIDLTLPDNKQVDILIKHIVANRHSSNTEAVGTAILTLQGILKGNTAKETETA